MLVGILSKLQMFFIGAVLFYVEEENICIVSSYSKEPLARD